MKTFGILALLSAFLVSVPFAVTYGYGTSSISLSQSSGTVATGASTSVNYTVNLASGNTWGTSLSVTDQAQLTSAGISTSLSNPNGDPPYSGVLTINVGSSTSGGTYQVTLAATGDDPSTSPATFTLTVPGSSGGTTSTGGTTPTTTPVTTPTTVQYTTTGSNYNSGGYGSALSTQMLMLIAGIVAALVVAAGLSFVFKGMSARMDIWGTALILIGIFIWLYGDFTGGNMTYIWSGVGVLILGVIVWLAGDVMAGAFKAFNKNTIMIIVGLLLILAGTGVWIYGDYHGGNMTDIWAGVGIIIVGTIIWLAGNAMSGAFKRM